jgi:hypothetical protein
MDRVTEQIEQRIDHERARLRSNLEELEDRVRSVTDWRRHYRGNPALWMGIAFGGGLLLSIVARSSAEPMPEPRYPPEASLGGAPLMASHPDHRRREISRAWRTIESALIGLAAAKLKQTLAQVLPGFREQLARHEGNGARDPASRDHLHH